MSIPRFGDKYDAPPLMSAADRLQNRFPDDESPTMPDTVVVTFQDYLYDSLTADATQELDVGTEVYSAAERTDRDDMAIVGEFGIGAPVLGIVLEELIAMDATRFLVVGGCGTLQDHVEPGDAIVVDSAVRDEGTSHHYLPPETPAEADPTLVDALTAAADAESIATHVGPTWTTDAFYRETIPELDHYRDQGVLCAEMEVATLFAIAQYRDVAAAAILTPFDRLVGDTWEWGLDADPLEYLEVIATIGLDAVT